MTPKSTNSPYAREQYEFNDSAVTKRHPSPSPPAQTAGSLRASDHMEAPTATRLLDAEALADRWLVSKAHVYRLAREGRVPTVRIGRYFRFRLEAIERWEAENEAGADA